MNCKQCGQPLRDVFSDAQREPIGHVCVNPNCHVDAPLRSWLYGQTRPEIGDMIIQHERLKEWMIREFKQRIDPDFEFTEIWAAKASELGFSFRKKPRSETDYRFDTGTQILQNGEVVAELEPLTLPYSW